MQMESNESERSFEHSKAVLGHYILRALLAKTVHLDWTLRSRPVEIDYVYFIL